MSDSYSGYRFRGFTVGELLRIKPTRRQLIALAATSVAIGATSVILEDALGPDPERDTYPLDEDLASRLALQQAMTDGTAGQQKSVDVDLPNTYDLLGDGRAKVSILELGATFVGAGPSGKPHATLEIIGGPKDHPTPFTIRGAGDGKLLIDTPLPKFDWQTVTKGPQGPRTSVMYGKKSDAITKAPVFRFGIAQAEDSAVVAFALNADHSLVSAWDLGEGWAEIKRLRLTAVASDQPGSRSILGVRGGLVTAVDDRLLDVFHRNNGRNVDGPYEAETLARAHRQFQKLGEGFHHVLQLSSTITPDGPFPS